jgi:hypothetical protein
MGTPRFAAAQTRLALRPFTLVTREALEPRALSSYSEVGSTIWRHRPKGRRQIRHSRKPGLGIARGQPTLTATR